MKPYQERFFELALAKNNLRFGSFTLKSGRVSPYFFNAGGFDDGPSLAGLANCYADAIIDSGISFDMLFGPSYKGIPLAAATAIALHQAHARPVPYAYNRKEAKDHGEGGVIVGAPLRGRVLVIDDVISAGTSVRESMDLILDAGAEAAGVAIALDREERGAGEQSAAQEVSAQFGVPVVAIAGLAELIDYLATRAGGDIDIEAIRRYRQEYGTIR
ncbi:MAG: orotate phosphoribosyltransferase [Xanthomonadales bacterium]|nr:orotate phosphoribosyltransferase [Xanthomonadales bacterium]